jgi:hypothetical protein
MSVYASIHLFLKRKYTYKGINRLFEGLNLENFSLNSIKKSPVYNAVDLRRFEGTLNFTVGGNQLIFDVAVEEYEGKKGTNVINLEFSASNRATYEYVHDSDAFFSILKKIKDLEGIALVGDDETAPSNNFYEAFKNGDFDIYLQPFSEPFSPTFYIDAWKRYLEKKTSMTTQQIEIFLQEIKNKWS